jgi:uncharacterized protein (TIGR03118 family)
VEEERNVTRPTKHLLRLTAAGATLALVVAGAHIASAKDGGGGGGGGDGGSSTIAPTRVTVVNQIANTSGNGLITDPDLKNPWGLALGPSGGALWVANNNSNNTTLYQGGLSGAAVTKSTLTVSIPGGKPTGQAFSGGTDFVVTGSGGSGPARFIFSSDQGDITAWNPTADRTHTILMAHVNGAVYRGLTFLATSSGNFLLANDFHNNRIDIFNSSFQRVTPAAGQFVDRNIPSGFAPFNVQTIGSSVYVAYARQGSSGGSDAGSDAGYVDVFTNFGMNVSRIISASGPRTPWGLAVAPSGWGAIAGDLLVGSFHDGFIYVYDGTTFVGQLATSNGSAVRIQRLWALTPGNPQNGGTNTLWFSAGPEDGQDGIVGELTPA